MIDDHLPILLERCLSMILISAKLSSIVADDVHVSTI